MALKMSEFHGIDPKHLAALNLAGIEDTDALMKLWSQKDKRADLVASSGIAEEDFMRFAAMARLGRVKGMNLEYLDALVVAGIDGPKRLFGFTPDTLMKHLGEVTMEKKFSGKVPSLEVVAAWFVSPMPETNGQPAASGLPATSAASPDPEAVKA